MLYLLDANVFIDAARDYYPLERVPEFWTWLEHRAAASQLKVPLEIFEEFKDGDDDLGRWARRLEVREALILEEDASPALIAQVIATGYAADLTDTEISQVGRDPFLVAAALVDPAGRAVVTTEVSAPSKRRANRRLPEVCRACGVAVFHTYQLLQLLDFRTGWR